MEERSLRDVSRPAEVIDRGGCEAFGTDDVLRRLEQPDACAAAFGRLLGGPWHDYTYHTVGMCQWSGVPRTGTTVTRASPTPRSCRSPAVPRGMTRRSARRLRGRLEPQCSPVAIDLPVPASRPGRRVERLLRVDGQQRGGLVERRRHSFPCMRSSCGASARDNAIASADEIAVQNSRCMLAMLSAWTRSGS